MTAGRGSGAPMAWTKRTSQVLGPIFSVAVAAAMLATAASATPAGSFDLTSVQAQREVKDVVLSAGVRVARAPKPSAHAAFTDTAGLTISIN